MKRLVVHVGPAKTATTHIQEALFTNEAVLRELGVYLPKAGRSELSSAAVSHHHLGWELLRSPRFRPRRGGWAALTEELATVDADTVLLSSEVLASAVSRGAGDELDRRLQSLRLPMTIVFVVREPLASINSGYGQQVKSFGTGASFREYVEAQLESRRQDLGFQTSRWYDSSEYEFVAVPFPTLVAGDPLTMLLGSVGIDVPAGALTTSSERTNITLGPVGVAAFRLLRHYLQGLNPAVSHHDLAMRRLHVIAARVAKEAGWCDVPYWGWTPDLAARVAEQLAASNERFAQTVWGHSLQMPSPVDRPPAQVELLDLRGRGLPEVQDFVTAMGKRYVGLLARPTTGAGRAASV